MEYTIIIGGYPCRVLLEQRKKMLVKRLDTVADVYEIHKVRKNGGKRSFHKTNRDLTKLTEYYETI